VCSRANYLALDQFKLGFNRILVSPHIAQFDGVCTSNEITDMAKQKYVTSLARPKWLETFRREKAKIWISMVKQLQTNVGDGSNRRIFCIEL